ncbi:hypothetical protein KUCAC02_015811 [Chaenocephalus aceratus]|uniref:Uncharacterized protein n=1 Tax=Chaenocephalus aceratus TaxID=36190 RepID=A0ACB9Y0F8_CHAAC|nr:hypothetical protein KUCAC02_015811 [Chaenocephalus aceratus]
MADTRRVTEPGRKQWVVPQRSPPDENKPSVRPPEKEAERSLAVPFRGHITGGMSPEKKVVMLGVVDSRPDRFYFALTCGRGTGGEPPVDVALELCVRFKDRQILRQACESGSWGETERAVPFFPFIRGLPFKIEIHCEHSRFVCLWTDRSCLTFSTAVLHSSGGPNLTPYGRHRLYLSHGHQRRTSHGELTCFSLKTPAVKPSRMRRLKLKLKLREDACCCR